MGEVARIDQNENAGHLFVGAPGPNGASLVDWPIVSVRRQPLCKIFLIDYKVQHLAADVLVVDIQL